MNDEKFEMVFDREVERARNTLIQKAKEYADDGDRLHNFKVAAVFQGITPEQALWGMQTKHLVSISDMVRSGDDYTEAQWDEKIGDALNYFILLRALIVEAESVDFTTEGARKIQQPTVVNIHQNIPLNTPPTD